MEFVTQPPDPAKGNALVDWDAVASALRASPGEWGKIPDQSRSMVSAIRAGRVSALRPVGTFEATSRREGNPSEDRANLYVRYVGE